MAIALLVALAGASSAQPLPPPVVPPENPITEPKRILGKILFWDEQLSSDNTVACGTCHRPASGGADPRIARHPGADGAFFTEDDVFGSQGVVRRDNDGMPIPDPVFGFEPQVTPRSAPSFFTSQDAADVFWDGRAASEFVDPETDIVVIAHIGALENQAITPILSDVEMAKEGRTWDDVRGKLNAVSPLQLATNLPPDVAAALAANPSYPDLFEAAFGDPAITAARIALSIATYERTLVADQTPFDVGTLTPDQALGLESFAAISDCVICHEPPHFTAFGFANLGVRPIDEDIGRQGVTGNVDDRGKFKIPSLRQVGLRPRFLHNGQRTELQAVLEFYADTLQHFGDNVDEILPVEVPNHAQVIDFLVNGLTDPRVASEVFPFDRPTLASESAVDVSPVPMPMSGAPIPVLSVHPNPFRPVTTLRYTLARTEDVRVTVFDVTGRLVRRLDVGSRPAGDHRLLWDGRDGRGRRVPAGTYFVRAELGSRTESMKVLATR